MHNSPNNPCNDTGEAQFPKEAYGFVGAYGSEASFIEVGKGFAFVFADEFANVACLLDGDRGDGGKGLFVFADAACGVADNEYVFVSWDGKVAFNKYASSAIECNVHRF